MTAPVFSVPADAACLDGHFPGRPLVPGVVILDHVCAVLAAHAGVTVVRVRRAKFAGALAPDTECRVDWRRGERTTRFCCRVGDTEIAAGSLEVVALESGAGE